MKVAAIYDIHANLPALEAVLQDIREAGVDQVVVGGDVVPGPMPRETLRCLLDLDLPVQFIHGNGELAMLAQMAAKDEASVTYWGTTSGKPLPEQFRPVYRWTTQQLYPDYESVLASWPKTLRLNIEGLGEVLFCHSTPRSETEIFTRLTPEDRLLPLFDELNVSIAVCGHTHMQFDRMIGKTRVVNAGSVGEPYGAPGAYWLLLGPDVQLKHTLYDLTKAAEQIRNTNFPGAEDFVRDITQPPAEAEMLEAYTKAELLPGDSTVAGNPTTNWTILHNNNSYMIGNALDLQLSIITKLRTGTRIYGYRPGENQLVYTKCQTNGANCGVSEIDVYLGMSAVAQSVISVDQIISSIHTVHFTADRRWMILTGNGADGSDGYSLYLVNLTENRPLIRKQYHISLAPYDLGGVRYVGSNVYNNRWLFASTDAGLTYLDLNVPDPVTTRKFISGIIPIAISADGRWLVNEVIASEKLGLLNLSKLDKGISENTLLNASFSTSSEVNFSADSRWLIFFNDTQFYVWDLSNLKPDSAALNIPMTLTHTILSQDQQWLGLLDQSDMITIINLSGDKAAVKDLQLDAQGRYIDFSFSPDSRWLATVDNQGSVSLYDLLNPNSKPLTPNRALNAVASIRFNTDQQNITLAGGTTNGKILLWNMSDPLTDSNKLPIILQGGAKSYNYIAFTPDSKWILAYGSDEPLKAWRAKFDEVLKFACEAAGRNLSKSEWTKYGFTEAYRTTCPQWQAGK